MPGGAGVCAGADGLVLACQRRFIRLLIKRAWLCLCTWLLVPAVLAALTLPIALTDPLKGWRMTSHPVVDAIDALILASDHSVGVRGIDYLVPPPSPPPTAPPPPMPPAIPPTASQSTLPQTVRSGEVIVLVEARDGGNMLSSANLAHVVQLESDVLGWLGDNGLCQLQRDSAHDGWSCRRPMSATVFLPPSDDVDECMTSPSTSLPWPRPPSSTAGNSELAAAPDRAQCTESGLSWRLDHKVMSHQLYNCSIDYFAAGT
jgi:hypothetical protein